MRDRWPSHREIPFFYIRQIGCVCLNHLFNIHDKLNKFIPSFPETDTNVMVFKEVNYFFFKGVLIGEEHSNHPIFNTPDWSELYIPVMKSQ